MKYTRGITEGVSGEHAQSAVRGGGVLPEGLRHQGHDCVPAEQSGGEDEGKGNAPDF